MRLFSLGFFLGVVTLLQFHNLPKIYWAEIACALSILLLLPLIASNRTLRFMLAICMGLGWAMLFANWQLQSTLSKAIESQDVMAQGFIVSIPEQELGGVRFEFVIKKLQQGSQNWPSPGKVRLTWEGQVPNLRVGDEWQLQLRLKRPHGTFNPGGFDEEAWLFSQDIRASGYVRPSQNNLLLNSQWYHSPLDRFRQRLADQIVQQLHGNPMTGFITALAVGVRNDIEQTQWETLRATGTNHLMAIAGLHIGLISGFTFFLVNFFWRLFPSLLLRIPAPQAAAFAALIVAFIYSALAGFSLPTQRAVIMITTFLLTTLLRRNLPTWHALLLALFIMLCLDPLAPLSSSFWLSFAAVALIIYGMSARLKMPVWWRHWSRIQWVLAVGLIPLTILFFQDVSLAGFLANMLAIPIVGFLVLPLTIIGSLLLLIMPNVAGVILKLAAWVLSFAWLLLQKIADITWLQWHIATTNFYILAAACVAVLLLLAPRGILVRWLGFIWLLPVIFYHPAPPKFGDINFTLLDVGQGLSAVIQTKNHILVYDTGAKYNDNFNMGDAVVVPYLRTLGINKIDMLVISHGDNDHSGGAQSVLQEMNVKSIFTSVPDKFPQQITTLCQQNQQWQWDGVNFEFLSPPAGEPYLDNESSCVLKITTGKKSLLLTGDIEHKSEQYLVQNEAQLLPADILVAPHHGSITSSSAAFVQAITPHYVLFPVGYLNRYHFPSSVVVARYQQLGAICYDSVSSGAIFFSMNNSKIGQPQQYRLSDGHFWNF